MVTLDFFEVQAYLCEEMRIDFNQFRDYQEVVGGDDDCYDFWQVWCAFDNSVGFVTVQYFYPANMIKALDNPMGDIQYEFGAWVTDLIPALQEMQERFGECIRILHR